MDENSPIKFDVFLAHNSQDKPAVRAIAAALRERGLQPWLDEEQIAPGRWFQDNIQEAISRVKAVAIFIGRGGIGKWQTVEIRSFISQCVESGLPMIPVLLPGVTAIPPELPFLKELNWIDLTSLSDAATLDKFEWSITGRRPDAAGKRDFFISYNQADRGWAQWIAWILEQAGHTTFLEAWDLRPGSNFALEMQNAATRGNRLVGVLSEDALRAPHLQQAWAEALARDPTGERRTFVPVRVRPCRLEGPLGSITPLELVGLQDQDVARDVLLAGIHRGRSKPAVAPRFPAGVERSVARQPFFPGTLLPPGARPHGHGRDVEAEDTDPDEATEIDGRVPPPSMPSTPPPSLRQPAPTPPSLRQPVSAPLERPSLPKQIGPVKTTKAVVGVAAVLGLGLIGYQIREHYHRKYLEEMVQIPGGRFNMGSVTGQIHSVEVAAFAMDRTPVTAKAYQACVSAGACSPPGSRDNRANISEDERRIWSQFCNGSRKDRDEHPITCVDWKQATEYCAWKKKRLPTEEEWEYAARGTDGRIYPWGKEPPGPRRMNGCGSECAEWAKSKGFNWLSMYEGDDGWPDTAPVGSYPDGKSPFDLLDMAGNISQWTASPYCDNYGDQCNDSPGRVVRGSAWGAWRPDDIRATNRSWAPPGVQAYSLGFRCAGDVSE